jgi:hypothetical protein
MLNLSAFLMSGNIRSIYFIHRSTSLQSLAERILFSTSENGHISVMFSEAINALLLLGIRYELAEMLKECFDAFLSLLFLENF